MTADDWRRAARELFEEAVAASPADAFERAERALGRPIWFWDRLTVAECHKLRCAVIVIALESRG